MQRLLRLALLLCLLVIPMLVAFLPTSWGSSGIPTSVGLLHFAKKNFKAGDWVQYQVDAKTSAKEEKSRDFQRVQIGAEITFRGEKCFWLETGYGLAPDRLNYSAVLVSENIFLDDQAELRPNLYLRKMHMETDPDTGTPLASEIRAVNPKAPLPDLSDREAETKMLGTDTLQTPRGPIVCQVFETKRVYRTSRSTADSSLRTITENKFKRWVNPEIVPITGLVREIEVRTYSAQRWAAGKPSTDSPYRVLETQEFEINLLDFGHKAKPQIADRIKDIDAFRGGGAVQY